MNAGDSFACLPSPAVGVGRRRVLGMALFAHIPARALDNPDGPDRTAEFLARARPFEQRLVDAPSPGTSALAAAAYAEFLDSELHRSYQLLLAQLGGPARRALVQSQLKWSRFHAAETEFIGSNWSPQNFGSSSALSRADYRSALVRQRVLTLLAYLQNYPAGAR
jgi:uncharacterized protein YecT (DUF1311 family)